jgi:KDO2-lipid IV(A) lauroyltransferase
LSSLSAALLATVGTVAERLPHGAALALGRTLGDVMMAATPGRRRRALSNLELAFGPALEPAARRRLCRRVFRHFGRTLVETMRLPRMVAQGLDRWVEHDGWHHLEAATAGGRGAILFTGHYGNWELMGLAQAARGIPVDVVGRPPGDPFLARRLQRTRELTGNRSISKYDAVRPMLRSLREGRCIGLVIDQNVGGGKGVFVDFFDRPASTTPALAVLALKTGLPVLPAFDEPINGRHRVVYGPPLEIRRTGDKERDILDLTARATAVIEEKVRRRPEIWLWMHNRWRSRPVAEAGSPGETP